MPLIRRAGAESVPARELSVVLAVAGEPTAMLQAVREALRQVDSRLPIVNPRTMASVLSDAMSTMSFTVILLGIGAGIALGLGVVGLYGVISYTVSQRVPEIGLRMALGAPAEWVRRDVVRQGMALAGMGLAIGLAGSWALSRVLASLVYGVGTTDPATYAATAVLLAIVSFLACWLSARRGSRVDPMRVLRAE